MFYFNSITQQDRLYFSNLLYYFSGKLILTGCCLVKWKVKVTALTQSTDLDPWYQPYFIIE